jgi:TolB-like protein
LAHAGGSGTYTRPHGGTNWIKGGAETGGAEREARLAEAARQADAAAKAEAERIATARAELAAEAARVAEERKRAAAQAEAAKAEEARQVAARAEAARAEAERAEAAALAELAAEAARKREEAEPPFTGDGGAGKSIAILLPEYKEADAGLPTMVQSALITDFKKYSAFAVLDRETLDRLLKETIDPAYTDNLDIVRLGHVTHTDYIMTGNIIKTSAGYVMSLHIANTIDGRINASSSSAYTLDVLENLTGIRKAAAELLTQLGVALTGKAQQELAGGF